MTLDFLIRNWALVGASVLGTAILLFVLYRLYEDSGRGRLQARLRELQVRERKARKARSVAARALRRLERLRAKAASARPRAVQEASDALEDARALQKIADDQLLIARNQVRKIILEEYPPKRHAAMRRRYLPDDAVEQKPFTMDA